MLNIVQPSARASHPLSSGSLWCLLALLQQNRLGVMQKFEGLADQLRGLICSCFVHPALRSRDQLHCESRLIFLRARKKEWFVQDKSIMAGGWIYPCNRNTSFMGPFGIWSKRMVPRLM